MTVVLNLRSPPTHAMEALRHEHECDLMVVKGIAVWIQNVLVDATRHRRRSGNGGPKQRLWWTFTEGKGREGQRMAIGQWAPPAADENTIPWLLAKPPPSPPGDRRTLWGGVSMGRGGGA